MLRSWQMQSAPNWNRNSAGHPHRIIFLHSSNGVAHFRRKNAIDLSAIIAKPPEVPLQGPDVGRLIHQVVAAFQIIERPPMITWRRIRRIDDETLVNEAERIPSRQRIVRMKDKDVLGLRRRDHGTRTNENG